jgi:hypothetical protein
MENEKKSIEKDISTKDKSKKNNLLFFILGGALVALVCFSAGVKIGLLKAKFSYHFGENYERNFIGPRFPMDGSKEFFGGFEGRDFRNAHGLAGTIISITDNSLAVKDRDGKENSVSVTERTIIKKFREDIALSDLKVDENVVILGQSGESGSVEAELIRVFDNKQ